MIARGSSPDCDPIVSSPGYDALLVAHVAAGLVGFGAVAIGGLEARKARQSPDPAGNEGCRRFFKPGIDWPARLIFLVPVLGLWLLFGGEAADEHAAWPWAGLVVWVLAVGVASGMGWPAERRAQAALAGLAADRGVGGVESADPVGGYPVGSPGGGKLAEFREACRVMERASGLVNVCFVAAVILMIVQP